MKNTDPRVDAYIAKAAPFARPILTRLRAAVLGEVPGKANEAMGQLGRITSLDGLPPGPRLRRWIRTAAQLNASTTPSRPKARKARPGTGKTRTARRKP
jgi:hypothetical protein